MPFAGEIPAFLSGAERAALDQPLAEAAALLQSTGLTAIADQIASLRYKPTGLQNHDGCITFSGKYTGAQHARLAQVLAHDLMPWRKGPFALHDLVIDAEWRSDKKWDRLLPDLPDLKGKTVADVGCNNGYHLYRIAMADAAFALGLDPTIKYWLQYRLLAAHAPPMPLAFLPVGWEVLSAMPAKFDVIFLMGVNYHDAQPLDMLHACLAALKPGGLLVCESVVIGGEGNVEIFPAGRYAGIGGVFGIPTVDALAAQLKLAGYRNVRAQHCVPLTSDEQRASEYSPHRSLADFLRDDGHSTEGYPPPHRAAIFAEK